MLRVPTGCPEQTLSSLAPVIILTCFLDAAGQWGKVGVELRDKVIENIISGYTRMLTHRSADGTYHTSKGNPGGTCILQPRAEHLGGGYRGSEADISLTAVVPIALDEGKELCSRKIENLTASMERARSFLEKRLPKIQTTFAVAIVSYALVLTESPQANDRLDSFASRNKTHWPVDHLDENSLYTTEATAYALMQKLELGRYSETHAIVQWLLEKRELCGGFKSTQALTGFRKAVPFEDVQDLRVHISVPKRALNLEWIMDQNNAYQQRSAKFSAQDDLEIKASGSGRGTTSGS
ncbi:complement C3-like [Prionailurus iriomotensis]